MLASTRKIRPRLAALAATACTASLAAGAAPSQAAAPERPTCPPAYDIGALTRDEARQLPRYVAAFADPNSGFTEDAFTAFFGTADRNGDGLLCFKLSPGIEELNPYAYQWIDNPGGNPG
jgi:hypothetical protein